MECNWGQEHHGEIVTVYDPLTDTQSTICNKHVIVENILRRMKGQPKLERK